MKPSASVTKTAKYLSVLAAVILVLLPLHAFITVWLSSLLGHYTLLRLWKEFLLVPLIAGALYILAADARLYKKLADLWITRLIVVYILLILICAFTALARNAVSSKAMWYGVLVDLRFLIFFLAVLVIASRSDWLAQRWQKLLFLPAILVGAFAILQFLVLPNDFLSHFGYGPATINPYETINHNLNHIRVESTLRGANPLGAYLIVPICALAVWLFKKKRQRLNKAMFGFGLLLALTFSFSRSGWIGAVIAAAAVAWFSLRSSRSKRIAGWIVAGALVIMTLLTFALRNNLAFENFLFHTDRASKASVSSNEGHVTAFKDAASSIIHQPLGGGVGSAGPQSVYNNKPARIAENYFLQIGQEAGALGMVLFIAICAVVGKMLYDRRADPLALALFAGLAGLTFVNLLSHAWEDDTVAYIWWGLAAIVLAPHLLSRKNT